MSPNTLLGFSRPWSRVTRRCGLAAAIACLLLMATVGISERRNLKQTAKLLDGRLLAGRLQEIYGRESVPAEVPPPPPHAYDWLDGNSMIAIAHGLGPQLWAGPNSRLTFEEGRRRGFRVFEIDLTVTTDGHLIAYHGESAGELDHLSWQQYREVMGTRGVEPLEFNEVVAWARAHPDLRFVLDVKNRFDDAYRMIRAAIGTPALGQSFIPQIYFFDQLPPFRADHFFAGEIFTVYRTRMRNATILRSAERLHVSAVAFPSDRVDSLVDVPRSISILTHPVDDAFAGAHFRAIGVRGIYTSYLTPAATPELFEPWPANCRPGSRWAGCRFGGAAVSSRN